MNRWVKICQQCWQENNPDQYCPDLTDYDECAQCHTFGLVLSVHPEDVSSDVEDSLLSVEGDTEPIR